jgi:hypothetical protein
MLVYFMHTRGYCFTWGAGFQFTHDIKVYYCLLVDSLSKESSLVKFYYQAWIVCIDLILN